jgi:hypothetical protein
LKQQPLKNAVLQGFSLKNARAWVKTVPPAVPGTLAHGQLVLEQAQNTEKQEKVPKPRCG